MNDEVFYTAVTMQRLGGHFASSIGGAMLVADSINQGRLVAAFPELMDRYGPSSCFYAGPAITKESAPMRWPADFDGAHSLASR